MLKNGTFYYDGKYIPAFQDDFEVGNTWRGYEIREIDLVAVVSADQYPRAILDLTLMDEDGETVTERVASKYEEKVFIIEENYVGPDQDQNIDADTIKITTEPARKNMSNEICLDGWCGTTDDWAVYARGEFPDLEAAEAYIKANYKDAREIDDFYDEGGTVKAVYKPGKYETLCKEETGNFIYDSLKESVNSSTTDDEIRALVDEWEATANSEGWTLTGAYDLAVAYRDE